MNFNEIIRDRHKDDADQLSFIDCDEKKIIITASAGCGKTTTLISKILDLIVNKKIKPYQKILCMSFSVNAAMNLKKSIHSNLSKIIGEKAKDYEDKIIVSNYHNFSLNLLKKYGYTINSTLKNLDSFRICSDDQLKSLVTLASPYVNLIDSFKKALNECDFKTIESSLANYCTFIKTQQINNNIITYNGMLVLANELLDNPQIRKFYNNYIGVLAIDEFQDTNYLQYLIAKKLFDVKYTYVLGDDCQKIYGFMGAIDDLFDTCRTEYNMHEIALKTNHRTNNKDLLEYFNFIRDYLYFSKSNILSRCYSKELKTLADVSNKIIQVYNLKKSDETMAIIFRKNTEGDFLVKELEKNQVDFFDARFTDSQNEYIQFHEEVADYIATITSIKKSSVATIIDKVSNIKTITGMKLFDSFIKLLSVCLNDLCDNVPIGKRKTSLLLILSYNGLKHYMDKINSKLFLITAHSSKGLEWDNVFIPFVNKYEFPICCKNCKNSHNCANGISSAEGELKEELRLYYVAITRAKNNLFLSYSPESSIYKNGQKSCFLLLKCFTEINY